MAESATQAARQSRQRYLIIILLFVSAILASTSLLFIAQNPATVKSVAPAKVFKLRENIEPSFIREGTVKFSVDRTKVAKLFFNGTLVDGKNKIANIIQVYQLSDGRLLNSFNWADTGIINFEYSLDGSLLAATDGTHIQVWRVSDGTMILNTTKLRYGINYLKFSINNSWLAVGNDRGLSLLNISDKAVLQDINANITLKDAVAYSPDEELFATFDNDKVLTLWSAKSGQPLQRLKSDIYTVSDLIFSADGQYLITSSIINYDNRSGSFIQFWRVKDGQLVNSSPALQGYPELEISPDGKMIASYCDDGVDIWQPDGKHISSMKIGKIAAIRDGMKFSQVYYNYHNRTLAAAFSPDGKLIATITAFQYLRIWQTENGRLLRTIRFTDNFPKNISFDESGKNLMVVHAEGDMRVWDVEALIKQ